MGRVRGRKRRRTPRLFGLTFRLVLIIAAACLFLSYISSYIDPSRFSVPLFFGLYFIPLLGINLLLFLIAAIRRSRSAWIPITALLPALLFAERFYKFNSGAPEATPEEAIKIETYNVGKFRLAEEGISSASAMEGIAEQINKTNPDIICLQEVYLDSAGAAARVFPGYRYRTSSLVSHSNGKRSGNLILSKFEILKGGVLRFRQSTNLSLFADIVIRSDTVRVYNNHLESYAISPTALIKKIREKRRNSEDVTEDIISVHNKFRSTGIKRSHQVAQIFSNIQTSPYPAIVCGDFNDTPMSFAYHKLSYKSKDTFKERGNGFSATYSMLWPLLRIDYIFIPETFTCLSHNTIRDKFSDHYPVVAEFSTAEPSQAEH